MSNFDFMKCKEFQPFSHKYFAAEKAYTQKSYDLAILASRAALESGLKWMANKRRLDINNVNLSTLLDDSKYPLGISNIVNDLRKYVVQRGNTVAHKDEQFSSDNALSALKSLHEFAMKMYLDVAPRNGAAQCRKFSESSLPEYSDSQRDKEFIQKLTLSMLEYSANQDDLALSVQGNSEKLANLERKVENIVNRDAEKAIFPTTRKKAIEGSGTISNVEVARNHIREALLKAKESGVKHVDIVSGDIHRQLGWVQRMPSVCGAMKSISGYKCDILCSPPSGMGATLKIRYHL